jgi:hypothetical protein
MNNTFDIKRFGNVVRHDGMSYFKNFGWTLVVLFSLPIVVWFFCYIMYPSDYGFMNEDRCEFLKWIMIVVMVLAPSRLYKTCNDSRKGIQFAIMPASSFEKFLSMLLFCFVLTPILYLTTSVAIDTFLSLIPGKNPYEGFVFKQIFKIPSILIDPKSVYCTYLQKYELPLDDVFIILSTTSVFMFTNMVFKHRKVSKTLGILVVLYITMIILMIRFDITRVGLNVTREEFFKLFYYVSYVLNFIISITMLYLTYRRIKKQTY